MQGYSHQQGWQVPLLENLQTSQVNNVLLQGQEKSAHMIDSLINK